MKITKTQLRQIIKEEVSRVLEYVGKDYSPKIFDKASKKRDINAPKNTPQEALEDVLDVIKSNNMTPWWTEKYEQLAKEPGLTHEDVKAFNRSVNSQNEQDNQMDMYPQFG